MKRQRREQKERKKKEVKFKEKKGPPHDAKKTFT